MIPVAGQPTYPAASAAEKASFQGAQVVVAGPRVVFNNPGSLLAVVVFTDGSHAPVIVDKRSAVVVSATGPAVSTPPRSRQPGRVPPDRAELEPGPARAGGGLGQPERDLRQHHPEAVRPPDHLGRALIGVGPGRPGRTSCSTSRTANPTPGRSK